MILKSNIQRLFYPVLLLIFSGSMAFLFPSIMYVDDYFFFGLKSIGSPITTIMRISETNTPAYSVYLLFWILSSFFWGLPIESYLHLMSFLIWAVIAYSLFRFAGEVAKNHKTLFVGIFLIIFLTDRPSNQNVFWSTQAIGSYIQHLLPVLILLNWVMFRAKNNKKINIIRDCIYCTLLFGFPGEILICTLLYILYLYFRKKSHDTHLLILSTLGVLIVILNLFSSGGKNRAAELNRPKNFEELFNRILTFYKFLLLDNFTFVLLCIALGFLLASFLNFRFNHSTLLNCTVLLSALIIALSAVCASAYQSTYHFIGINFLIQALSMACGTKIASRLYLNRGFNLKKSERRPKNLFILLSLPIVLFVSFTLPQKVDWLYNQSHSFLIYSKMLLDNEAQNVKFKVYNFEDSSKLGVIGPNIPNWETYGLASLDFVEFGVEEAISVINKRSHL